jgi:hypothetical protein
MASGSATSLMRVGQLVGALGAITILAFWFIFIRTPKPATVWFFLVALASMGAAILAILAAAIRNPLLMGLSFLVLLPWAFYFIWTNSIFRWISYGSFALGLAAVCLVVARILEVPRS